MNAEKKDKKYEKLTTAKFRVSFPSVFQARSFEGGPLMYSVTMLFKKTDDIKAMKTLAAKTAEAKFGAAWKSIKNFKWPFKDGDEKDLEGYAGMVSVRASSKSRPGVVDNNLQAILSEDDFYAGCFARATVTCFAFDKAGNKGVSFGLQNLQKLADGEKFSGKVAAENDFDAVNDGSGEDVSNYETKVDDDFMN